MELETKDTPVLPSEIITKIFEYIPPKKLDSLAESSGEIQPIAQYVHDNFIKNKVVKLLKYIFYTDDATVRYNSITSLIKIFKKSNYRILKDALIKFYKEVIVLNLEVIVVNLRNPKKKYRQRAYNFKKEWRANSLDKPNDDVEIEPLKEIYKKGDIKELDSIIKSFVNYRQKTALKIFYNEVIVPNFSASDLKGDCYGRNILQWRVICHQKLVENLKESIAQKVLLDCVKNKVKSLFTLAFDFKNYEFIESIAETMASKYGKNELAKILMFGDLCIKYSPNKECDNEKTFYRKKIRNYIRAKYKNLRSNTKNNNKTYLEVLEDFKRCNKKCKKFQNTTLAGIFLDELDYNFKMRSSYSADRIYTGNPVKRFIGWIFFPIKIIKFCIKIRNAKRKRCLRESVYRGKNTNAMTKEQRKKAIRKGRKKMSNQYKCSASNISNLLNLHLLNSPTKEILSAAKQSQDKKKRQKNRRIISKVKKPQLKLKEAIEQLKEDFEELRKETNKRLDQLSQMFDFFKKKKEKRKIYEPYQKCKI